jgi:hypothetical protein
LESPESLDTSPISDTEAFRYNLDGELSFDDA